MRIIHRLLLLPVLLLSVSSSAAQDLLPGEVAPKLTQVDRFTLKAAKHLVSGYPARGSRNTVHVVVEIPAGTNAKWEVDKADGQLKWEFKNKKPRIIQYLPYPGNYGMVPRTLLPTEFGGDGDPLDVLVLGPAIRRGTVIEAKIIGVLKLLDGGEQDDKLIAVIPGSAFGGVDSFGDLQRHYKGVAKIIETWFANYKGRGKLKSKGFGDASEANTILDAAIESFEKRL